MPTKVTQKDVFASYRAKSTQKKVNKKQLKLLAVFMAASQKIHRSAICERIQNDPTRKEEFNKHLARAVFDQMIVFLWLASIAPEDHRFSPPIWIDGAWHQFVLNTPEYAEFCRRIGQFIHHIPTTSKNRASVESLPIWLPDRSDVAKFAGEKSVVMALWWDRAAKAAGCSSHCHNCSDCSGSS